MAFPASPPYSIPLHTGTTRVVANQGDFDIAINAMKAAPSNDCIILEDGSYEVSGLVIDLLRGLNTNNRAIICARNKGQATLTAVYNTACYMIKNSTDVLFYGVHHYSHGDASYCLIGGASIPGSWFGEGKNTRIRWQHCSFVNDANVPGAAEAAVVLSGPTAADGTGNQSTGYEVWDCLLSKSGREGIYFGYGNEVAGNMGLPRVIDSNVKRCELTNTGAVHPTGGEAVDIKPASLRITIEDNWIHDCIVGNQGAITFGLSSFGFAGLTPGHVIKHNRVANITPVGGAGGEGIYGGCNGCQIIGNTVWGCKRGISLGRSNQGLPGGGYGAATGGATLVAWNTVWGCSESELSYGAWGYSSGGAGSFGYQTASVVSNLLARAPQDFGEGSTTTFNENKTGALSWFVTPVAGTANDGTGPGGGFRTTSTAQNSSDATVADSPDIYGTTRGGTKTAGAFQYVAPGGGGGQPPVASFTWAPFLATTGVALSLSDLSSNAPTSWLWNFGGGSGTTTIQNPTVTFPAAGTYTVQLTATNANGSGVVVMAITVVDPPPPPPLPLLTLVSTPAVVLGAVTLFAGQRIFFTFLDTAYYNEIGRTPPPLTILWQTGDARNVAGTANDVEERTGDEVTFTHVYERPGSYTARLSVTSAYGTSVVTVAVTVIEPPPHP